jgi:pimeloyl-ACP methyl ester carboxylesterase
MVRSAPLRRQSVSEMKTDAPHTLHVMGQPEPCITRDPIDADRPRSRRARARASGKRLRSAIRLFCTGNSVDVGRGCWRCSPTQWTEPIDRSFQEYRSGRCHGALRCLRSLQANRATAGLWITLCNMQKISPIATCHEARRARLRNRWRRATLIAVSLLVVGGVLFEHAEGGRAWQRFPPPGALVDIGGRKLQLDCRGEGTPTVVLEAGLDTNGSLSWSLVHGAIATITRACAYSRAGIMWSDRRASAVSVDLITHDLHQLLGRAREQPPFVMVGHSLGGDYVVAYTQAFPSDVAGLVLVDASHPDLERRMTALLPNVPHGTPWWYRWKVALAWSGLMRFDRDARTGIPHQPPVDIEAMAAYAPHSLVAMLQEEDAMRQTLATVRVAHRLGNRPTAIVTGTAPLPEAMRVANGLSAGQARQIQELWLELQADEASWSSRSTKDTVSDAGHYVQFDRPDAVVAAVQSVVAAVRAHR